VIQLHPYRWRFLQHLDSIVVLIQLEEYSDPFDLKKATAEKEALASASDVILPLSEDDYSVPYEMKDRHQGKKKNAKLSELVPFDCSKNCLAARLHPSARGERTVHG